LIGRIQAKLVGDCRKRGGCEGLEDARLERPRKQRVVNSEEDVGQRSIRNEDCLVDGRARVPRLKEDQADAMRVLELLEHGLAYRK
jgi:hypothetical protein